MIRDMTRAGISPASQADRVELEQAEFQFSVANVRVFESRDLIVATDKFNPGRLLGEGRLGRVYKGILEDGQVRAVVTYSKCSPK
ncbi:hypothetical protein MKW94_006629 [Papaver nudicaule]|uniref:Uncharacterized protein n=1 Tax=Papaver nudicaule TaxID=74823 RepID=A0AA41VV20_PAPNU|nr:hypothetical protein [Papaver nudicaule]